MSTKPRAQANPISQADRERRREMVAEVRHSSAMEGARSTDDARTDQDAWVEGRITLDELIERLGQHARRD